MHVLRAIVATSSSFLAEPNLHLSFEREGLVRAVEAHDTARLYEWLVGVLSFQGVSDTAARSFIGEHGLPGWEHIAAFLETAACPKLLSHWNFTNCGFVRTHGSCSTPDHYGRCPVPALPLRNGSLNRMAFSLFLFLRDVCEGDLVGWIDRHLASVSALGSDDYGYRLGQALIQPMRGIQGASDKVLNMALSDFLIAVDPARELWRLAGSHMVAIDSLDAQFAAPERRWPSTAPNMPTARPAIGLENAPTLFDSSHTSSTPANSTQRFQRCFRAWCNTRSGTSVPRTASTSAMACRSTMLCLARTRAARCSRPAAASVYVLAARQIVIMSEMLVKSEA